MDNNLNNLNNEQENKSEKRIERIITIIVFVMIISCLAGGTYAWLTYSLNAVNNVYNSGTHCFNIDYNINNIDNTQDITGTMFPSAGPIGGLNGRIGLKVNDSCDLLGRGTIKMHINTGTSTRFGTVAAAHCVNPTTLETLDDYETSNDCTTHNGSWTTTETVLKYAVYNTTDTTQAPVSVGYITTSDIGNDKVLYNNFTINKTQQYYYIYLWLDGYTTDGTYTELPFSATINAEAIQLATVTPTPTP